LIHEIHPALRRRRSFITSLDLDKDNPAIHKPNTAYVDESNKKGAEMSASSVL
jgi:hypothetical protein